MVETQKNNFENQEDKILNTNVDFKGTQAALEGADDDFELTKEQEKVVKKFEKMQDLSNLAKRIDEGMKEIINVEQGLKRGTKFREILNEYAEEINSKSEKMRGIVEYNKNVEAYNAIKSLNGHKEDTKTLKETTNRYEKAFTEAGDAITKMALDVENNMFETIMAQAKIEQLELKNKKLEKDNALLELINEQKDLEIKKLEGTLTEKEEENKRLNEEIEKVQTEGDNLKKDLEESENTRKKLEGSVNELKKDVKDLKRTNKELQDQIDNDRQIL